MRKTEREGVKQEGESEEGRETRERKLSVKVEKS